LSFVSSLPDFKQGVKTTVFIGKFNDQTLHVAGCARAGKFYFNEHYNLKSDKQITK